MPAEPHALDDKESRVAVAGHPIHPMLVTFPIAFLLALVPSDLAWLLTGDPFWARLSFWLAAAGTFMGLLAALAGTIELLAIPGVRRRGAAWNHFVAGIMLLAVAFSNTYLRLAGPEDMIMPWGLSLSLLGAILVGMTGWLGGHLVFQHQVAVVQDDGD